MDHVHRVGRQVAALRAGGFIDWANRAHEAAKQFIEHFGYGDEGRVALTACYRMAKMEDPKKPLFS